MGLPSNKTLILVRHAHRDTSEGRELDNGLSRKGQRQAKRVRKFFFKRFGDEMESVVLLSSPKKRCVETLSPLADLGQKKVQIELLLAEQDEENGESTEGLQKRIQEFLNEWKTRPELITVACSHGDWLPLALKKLFGLSTSFKKGAWAEIESRDGSHRLTWLVQEP